MGTALEDLQEIYTMILRMQLNCVNERIILGAFHLSIDTTIL